MRRGDVGKLAFGFLVVATGCGALLGIDPDGARVGASGADGSPMADGGDPSADAMTDGSAAEDSGAPKKVVSAGFSHTCAVTPTGGAKCWGRNTEGELGNNSTASSLTPVQVVGLASGVVAVAAGGDFTCALTASGGVKCWGADGNGQLGNGAGLAPQSLTPVDVNGLSSGVVAITAGNKHACALTTSGAAKCWGSNTFGQVGNTTTDDARSPTNVSGLAAGVRSISAGTQHTCAVVADGHVKCWGADTSGQLGTGDAGNAPVLLAVDVPAPPFVDRVVAGAAMTCAILPSGNVNCWGANVHGQLGDGTTTPSRAPVEVRSLDGGVQALSLAGLNDHACAITNAYAVRCWGLGTSGQLGDGLTINQSTPVGVTGASVGVHAIAAGTMHSCALASNGSIYCWGANDEGQLGNATKTPSLAPVRVVGFP